MTRTLVQVQWPKTAPLSPALKRILLESEKGFYYFDRMAADDKIKFIYFDLDDTLFDHTRSEQMALKSLFQSMPQTFASIDQASFLRTYKRINGELWTQMAEGKISAQQLKRLRFELTFKAFDVGCTNADEISRRYLEVYSQMDFVLPNTTETLQYLNSKYELGILSNGFEGIQETKLRNTKLGSYFLVKIFSGNVGAMKPDPRIFSAATQATNVRPAGIVYVGDSYENDIVGAKAAGWRCVFFNPNKEIVQDTLADHEITDLLHLTEIF
ncbi:MAG: YjjG family noncanonical pyrimidine nucleotidase [bacterium]